MKLTTMIAFIALAFLSACASQSAYKPASGSGFGYTETAISENQYRVHFKSRGENRTRAMDYALLRSAELTLLKGYDWFVVVSRDTTVDSEESSVQANATTQRVVTRDCGLLGCSTQVQERPAYGVGLNTGDPGQTETVLEIRLGKGVRPSSGDSYDALEVRENLQDKA